MAEQLIVPKLGMAAAVVTLTEWKAKEGDRIEEGDAVLDIEAEKSTFEMPAPISGFLHILMPQGVETDVNTVVGLIAASREEYLALGGTGGGAASAVTAALAVLTEPAAQVAPAQPDVDEGRIFITPIARRMAAEHDLDIARIAGSGPRGRIQKGDVEKTIERRQAAAQAVPPAPSPVLSPMQAPASRPITAPLDDHSGKTAGEVIPYRGMRKAIGENMLRSLAINAPNTMSGDFDLTIMTRYRENFVQQESKLGTRITFADLMLYAVAKALRRFPLMNSSLVGDEIRLWQDINLGMAVALGDDGEKGLVVPVIRNADRLSLVELSRTAKDLGRRAREGGLARDEMRGGTFTVSNFGSLGVSSYSTPIINMPEAGILGIGRLQKKPIVRGDGIVIAPMLPYSLTHDHRTIDGAAAERFLGILKQIAESTSAELSELIIF